MNCDKESCASKFDIYMNFSKDMSPAGRLGFMTLKSREMRCSEDCMGSICLPMIRAIHEISGDMSDLSNSPTIHNVE